MTRTGFAVCGFVCVALSSFMSAGPQQAPVFRSGTSATSVNVSVMDRNRAVAGLAAADFIVTDNGVPQKVEAISIEATPIDVTLVLDVSGSAPPKLLKDARDISTLLRVGDRFSMLSFSTTVQEGIAMSASAGASPSVTTLPEGGATALFNALTAALVPLASPGRPHLVMALTDGGDNISLLSDRDVLEMARRSDAALQVLIRVDVPDATLGTALGPCFCPQRWLPFDPPITFELLGQAAVATGGRLNTVPRAEPAEKLFKRVIEEFRSGYVLWFTPTGVTLPGWHELSVRVPAGKYTVSARRGYFGG
jgi:VWFA-related protein